MIINIRMMVRVAVRCFVCRSTPPLTIINQMMIINNAFKCSITLQHAAARKQRTATRTIILMLMIMIDVEHQGRQF